MYFFDWFYSSQPYLLGEYLTALSVSLHVARAVAVVVAVDFADSYVVGCERVVFGS